MNERTPHRKPGRLTPYVRVLLAALAAGLAVLAASAPAQESASGQSQWVEGIRIGLPNFIAGTHPDRPRIMYRDSLTSINDICPVRKARLDPDRKPVYVNGKPVGFCCSPCPVTFSSDPEKYLTELHAAFPCPVHPGRKAIFDSSLRARVNQDIFFFSSVSAKNRFVKDPLRYAKYLTDPVTFQRFRATKSSPRAVFRGRDYYFATDSTLAAFQAEPEKWFERKTSH